MHAMFCEGQLMTYANKNAIKDNFESIETNLSEAIGMSEGVWGETDTQKKKCVN